MLCEMCQKEEATHEIKIGVANKNGRSIKKDLCVPCATDFVKSLTKNKDEKQTKNS